MSTLRSQSNKSKKDKDKKKRFSWGKHEQTLKDFVLKNDYLDPTPEDFVKIAEELSKTYKIENISADTVRWKFRTKIFKKWLRKQGSSEDKKRKREATSSNSVSSSENTSDSYSDSVSDSDSQDLNCQIPTSGGKGYASQPVFWTISDSDCWWYFMRRKWKIQAKHFTGKQYVEIEYRIDPPTVFDLQN
jgi:hypothetical protein